MKVAQMPKLAVIGDSHATFWTGINAIQDRQTTFAGVDIFHIGPATAHNLMADKENTSRYIRSIESTFGQRQNVYGAAVLCFGEIDCRVHVIKSALDLGTSIKDAVDRTSHNYMKFVDWFSATYRIPIVLWGPGPSSGLDSNHLESEYPRTGTNIERNYATHLFNLNLEAEARKRSGIGYGSIFRTLIEHNGTTRSDAHFDNCHVDVRHMTDAVSTLKRALLDAGATDTLPALEQKWLISETPSLWNLAARIMPAYTGRVTDGRVAPFRDSPSGQIQFKIESGPGPLLTLDLRAAFSLSSIKIFGSLSGIDINSPHPGLAIECGNTPQTLAPIFSARRDSVLSSLADPLTVARSSQDAPARFVRVRLSDPGSLAIDTIQVQGKLFDSVLIR
jgi:hypothetical protein